MDKLGPHTGLYSSGGEKPHESEGSPETPSDLLTKVNGCTAHLASATLLLKGRFCGQLLRQLQQHLLQMSWLIMRWI